MRPLPTSVLAALALGAISLVFAAPSQAAATTYYVSATTGSDANAGTSPSKPLASLGALNRVVLKPGDTVNLDAASTWLGPLSLDESGTASARITVQAWKPTATAAPTITGQSTGDCVVVKGSYVTISGIKAFQCGFAGIDLRGDYDTVTGSTSTGNVAGVQVEPGGDHAIVQSSSLSGNNRLSVDTAGGDDDSGAFGVLVNGDDALVQGNVINDNYAYSHDYGNDGSAVEVYAAVGTKVLRNHAAGNAAFIELGSDPTKTTADTTIAYNDVTGATAATTRTDDVDAFLVTRGSGASFGPVNKTVAAHNSVYLTNPNSQGVVCVNCSASTLTLEANVVRAVAKSAYFGGPYAGGSNFWFGGQFQLDTNPVTGQPATKAAKDQVGVDPRFVSTTNLALQTGSPAIDYAPATAYTTDIEGTTVPRDGNNDGKAVPDSGAHEK